MTIAVHPARRPPHRARRDRGPGLSDRAAHHVEELPADADAAAALADRSAVRAGVRGSESDGSVPHFCPARTRRLDELTKLYHIPREAVLGGAQTMYPEYRKKMKDTFVRPEKCPAQLRPRGTTAGRAAAASPAALTRSSFVISLDHEGRRGLASERQGTARRKRHLQRLCWRPRRLLARGPTDIGHEASTAFFLRGCQEDSAPGCGVPSRRGRRSSEE